MIGRQSVRSLLRWAWPRQSVDQLLRAAALRDESAARAAWLAWQRNVDFDALPFPEMRLLAAVAPRLGRLDPEHAERARIAGIERMLWSRSQMVLREVRPALRLLADEGIELMLLKGAARVAREATAIKSRTLNDVDVLVRPESFRRAFDLSDAAGWRSTGSGSALYHRTLLDHVHGLNLIQGDMADLDLHRSAFHPPHQLLAEDASMWTRSQAASLAGCAARVPSATDTVVVAIAHGGVDGNATSDWMLDIVNAIGSGAVDWDLLIQLVERRRLVVPAAIALDYLAERLQSEIPIDVLRVLVDQARRRPGELVSGLLLARPKNSMSPPMKLARGVAKLWHSREGRQKRRSPSPCYYARSRWKKRRRPDGPPVYRLPLALSGRSPQEKWRGEVKVTILLDAPGAARRIEFELNSDRRHLARLRHRKILRGPSGLTLMFRAALELEPSDRQLTLEAVSGKGLREHAAQDKIERYGRLPFQVVRLECRRRAA